MESLIMGSTETAGRLAALLLAGVASAQTTLTLESAITLPNLTEADAIEGIAVHNGKLYVANDGYYHAPDGSDPALNRILVYPLPATGGTMTATTLSVGTLTIGE